MDNTCKSLMQENTICRWFLKYLVIGACQGNAHCCCIYHKFWAINYFEQIPTLAPTASFLGQDKMQVGYYNIVTKKNQY